MPLPVGSLRRAGTGPQEKEPSLDPRPHHTHARTHAPISRRVGLCAQPGRAPRHSSALVSSSTPGYIFGKRIILFLFLMSLAGVANYYLILFFGSDFENYIKTVTTTISPLLLIP